MINNNTQRGRMAITNRNDCAEYSDLCHCVSLTLRNRFLRDATVRNISETTSMDAFYARFFLATDSDERESCTDQQFIRIIRPIPRRTNRRKENATRRDETRDR